MIPHSLSIINYHKIEKNSDIGITTRHPDQFRLDLEVITENGYTPITFHDLHLKRHIPEKPLIITFDDGYQSFYDTALPVLKQHKMKAVIFIPVNYIGQKNNWDVQFFKKKYGHMDKKQIADVAAEGMEIGSHALSHCYLNDMNSEKIKHELRKSKLVLEEITAKEVISISYPFGRVNKKVLSLAKEFYKYGVQLLHSNTFEGELQSLCLTRINIYRTDNRKTFLKKLEYNKYPWLRLQNRLIQSGALATVLMQKFTKAS